MVININIKDKIAKVAEPVTIICGNTDYEIRFAFDEEWVDQKVKTARFIYNNKYIDVVFEGEQCKMPKVINATGVFIGVFAGDLHTTTPAFILCEKSILCRGGTPAEPVPDVYAQIMELINSLILNGGGEGGNVSIIVDSILSLTSINPVQNKVVTNALNNKQDKLNFDETPTKNSQNLVKSGDLYNSLNGFAEQVQQEVNQNFIKSIAYTDEKIQEVSGGATPAKKKFERICKITVAPDPEDGELPDVINISLTGDHTTNCKIENGVHKCYDKDNNLIATVEESPFELTDFYIIAQCAITKGTVTVTVNNSSFFGNVSNVSSLVNTVLRRWSIAYRTFGKDMGGQAFYPETTINKDAGIPNNGLAAWRTVLIPPKTTQTTYPYNSITKITISCATEGATFIDGSNFELWGVRK